MIPCMGAWCKSRDKCAHYYAESKLDPIERLCGEVEEIESMGNAIRFVDMCESVSKRNNDLLSYA